VQELLLSDEFRKYRKAQLAEIVAVIRPLMLSGKAEEVKGALDMAMRMIKLPVKLSPDKIKDAVSGMIEEDVNDFHVRFIRSHIMEE
jgi:hypothetical protein